jgi:rhamnosyltransferase subunit B
MANRSAGPSPKRNCGKLEAPMRIVFAPWGSLGDLHPHLAVAIELKRRGYDVVLATSEMYRAKVEGEGLPLVSVRPDIRQFIADSQLIAKAMHPRRGTEYIFRHIVMPSLKDSFADMEQAAKGADLLVTHAAMHAGPIVAERLGIPWVSVALQPAAFLSTFDPSYFPPFGNLVRRSRWLARLSFRVIRLITQQWMGPVYRLRQELGLRNTAHPLFEGQFSPWGTLAMFSPVLARPQEDWPSNTTVTGFSFYDKFDTFSSGLPEELAAFCDAGDPPVVFTLGSSAVLAPGDFFDVSAEVASCLGKRAVLLAGPEFEKRINVKRNRDIQVTPYASYSAIFPKASAIVHSGGVGTTAQALRAGKPMIVIPFSHDQPDNGARITRLGVGKMITRRQYKLKNVSRELQSLLVEPRFRERACQIGRVVQGEDGTGTAADALERAVSFKKPRVNGWARS